MEIHFDNIKEKIIKEISLSKFNVYVAVAWMDEKFILKELVNCLKRGIQVEILINDDKRFHKDKFKEFEQMGGKIFLYDTATSLMHNKFCVIDLCTTITGSFNYTIGATHHQENIIVEKNNLEVAHLFAIQFVKLKRKSTLFSNINSGNADLAHKVKVRGMTCYNDNIEGIGCIIELEEGNRRGFIHIKGEIALDSENIPNEIQGFWKSKLEVENFGENDKNEYYDFICLDPLLIKYLA